MEALKERILELKKRLKNLMEAVDIVSLKRRIEEINLQMSSPDFWNDRKKASLLTTELKRLKSIVEKCDLVNNSVKEIEELVGISEPEDSEFILKEIEKVEKKFEDIELELALSGEHDKDNAIVTIHPGAGGTESQDWAQMLMRMYLRWAERKGFAVEILDYQPASEAGIKNVTFLVKGENAYGLLKSEHGVHRLVRISPFDASHRRHTSFAMVSVLPEILEEDPEVEINENDLKIETFRASGPGGQHMQKNETAIRITHIPTGIVVTSQSERSQYQNKTNALKILRARLYEYYKKQKEKEKAEFTGPKKEIAWGNQIRSYVLHPYLLVKDHRTGYETSNAQAVLDGEIEGFIKAYLLKIALPEAVKK